MMRTMMRAAGAGVVLAIVLGFFLAGVRCGQSVAARGLADAARHGRPWRVRGESYVPMRLVAHQALYRELGRAHGHTARPEFPDHPTEAKP